MKAVMWKDSGRWINGMTMKEDSLIAAERRKKKGISTKNSPMFSPKSVLVRTRTLKSACTLPIISTAWLTARWASYNEHEHQQHEITSSLLSTGEWRKEKGGKGERAAKTHPVQMHVDLTAGINSGFFSSELGDFS
jgi:hypothetical protein